MLRHQLLQALIELAPAGSEERALLESLSNHVGAGQVRFSIEAESGLCGSRTHDAWSVAGMSTL